MSYIFSRPEPLGQVAIVFLGILQSSSFWVCYSDKTTYNYAPVRYRANGPSSVNQVVNTRPSYPPHTPYYQSQRDMWFIDTLDARRTVSLVQLDWRPGQCTACKKALGRPLFGRGTPVQ